MKREPFSPVGSCARTFLVAAAVAALAAPGLAQDSILVADFSGSRVVKLAFPSGAPQSHFVGTGMTAINGTEYMTYGPGGSLYIASYNNSSVFRVDGQTGEPIGTFVASGSGGLSGAVGIAFGPDGRLYVSSNLTHSVAVYNGSTGAFISLFVTPGLGTLTNAQGIAFDGAGDLYVCSYGNDKVLKYSGTTGAFISEALTAGQLGINGPRGIMFDAGGRMYVCSQLSHSIVVKDPVAGVSLLASNATIPALLQPGQPALSAGGDLLVPCQGNGTVQRLNRNTGASLGTLVQGGAGGMTNAVICVVYKPSLVPCYANCDNSTSPPVLNINDFICFQARFAAGCQ